MDMLAIERELCHKNHQTKMEILAHCRRVISQPIESLTTEILPEYQRSLNIPGFIPKLPTPTHYAQEWKNLNIEQLELIQRMDPPHGSIAPAPLTQEEILKRKADFEERQKIIKNKEYWEKFVENLVIIGGLGLLAVIPPNITKFKTF